MQFSKQTGTDMNKKILAFTGILLIAICFIHIWLNGSTYVLTFDTANKDAKLSDYDIADSESGKIVHISDVKMDNGFIKITCEGVSKGKTLVSIVDKDGIGRSEMLYVHSNGLITAKTFFGDCTGSHLIPLATALYILLLIIYLINRYRQNVKNDMYRYKNVLELGLIVFLLFLLWNQFHILGTYNGLADSIRSTMDAAGDFSIIMFPVAFVMSILISLSNIRLMMKEGKTWRNMLGLILGLMLMTGTVIPVFIGNILQTNPYLNVHEESGTGHLIEMAVDSASFIVVAYLECILIGSILYGIKAARHIPKFDKDYILILGCQIRKDGTLTPLLQSRADRALDFGKMQKEAAGKDIKYVPSGGQGRDEVMAEADAIKEYLLSRGIPEDRIIVENKSLNTIENIRNSMNLIKEDFDGENPEAAFSTTNYHVFRSGMIASQQGFKLEGIGSKTKSYFWINAFVREYIAMLSEERKTHIKILAVLIALSLLMVLINYLSIIL